jgi:hypothetical protein
VVVVVMNFTPADAEARGMEYLWFGAREPGGDFDCEVCCRVRGAVCWGCWLKQRRWDMEAEEVEKEEEMTK